MAPTGKYYPIDGKNYPRVTWILDVTMSHDRRHAIALNQARNPVKATQTREQAADRGTWVHGYVAQALNGITPPLDQRYAKYLHWLRPWLRQMQIANPQGSIFAERLVFHPELGYAGTFDLLAISPAGVPTLYDLKTCGYRPYEPAIASALLQIEAYRRAFATQHSALVPYRIEAVFVSPYGVFFHSRANDELEPLWREFQFRLKQFSVRLNSQED